MRIFRKAVGCLLVFFLLFVGYACSNKNTSYEIVMDVIIDGESFSVSQETAVFDMNIGTAPFQNGNFPIRVSFKVMQLQGNSKLRVEEWYPLEPWGRLLPSEHYGSRVDLHSYYIYDENGELKNQSVSDWKSRDFFSKRHNDIDHINYFYLANISGLHEITYKVSELTEYDIPETMFTIKLYAEEDERNDGVKIMAQEDPNITKIDGGEDCYDIYLISQGAKFPEFKICKKDTGEDLQEDYNYYIRRFEPNYEENEVILNSLQDRGKINWAYIQFEGNELYQPTSYYFYVIYLY